MELESSAFKNNEPIPREFTCQGKDIPPPLFIRNIPLETKALALIVDDPDAPSGTFDHWIVWNILPSIQQIDSTMEFSNQGKNGFGVAKYKGPCPPPGKPHRYFFKLYALDSKLELPTGATKAQLEAAMKDRIIEKTQLVGTYQRAGE